jgi:hypothetical protein
VQDVNVADKALCNLQRMVQDCSIVFRSIDTGKDMFDAGIPDGRYVELNSA